MSKQAEGIKPEDRRHLILGAFETLVQAERAGVLSDEFKSQVIWEAYDYARRNHLNYDGTFRGAMKLAEMADKMVQDHHAIEQKEVRDKLEAKRRKLGVSGKTRVKDLIQ